MSGWAIRHAAFHKNLAVEWTPRLFGLLGGDLKAQAFHEQVSMLYLHSANKDLPTRDLDDAVGNAMREGSYDLRYRGEATDDE